MRVTRLRLNQRFVHSTTQGMKEARYCLLSRLGAIMFGLKKKSRKVELVSPVNGKMIRLRDVPDQVFASEMMGPGVAFISNDGNICSPCDGELMTVFPTKHAIGIKAENGAEILIHFGIDTVQLEGSCFHQKIDAGNKVKKGDLIIEADIEAILEQGYSIDTPMIITNANEFHVTIHQADAVTVNTAAVISIEKK